MQTDIDRVQVVLEKMRERRTRLSNRARGKKETRTKEIGFAIRELNKMISWIEDRLLNSTADLPERFLKECVSDD